MILPAHEDKVVHRLANMAKIKAELVLDDFLEQDDPRVMSEGDIWVSLVLVDKF
jgi:hypothetical protein